jgi:hypothetical protein
MSEATRRTFLTLAGAGAGAAVVGLGTSASADAATVRPPSGASGPLVAYVTDMQRGELTLMVGEDEIVVHDSDLTARLAHAAHGRTA